MGSTREITEWNVFSDGVQDRMSAQQQDGALALADAMAAGPLQEFGVDRSSLLVVRNTMHPFVGSKLGPQEKFTVVHTGDGIDLGVPGAIDVRRTLFGLDRAEYKRLFRLTVMGEEYDALSGMTEGVYRAMIQELIHRGRPSPDIETVEPGVGPDPRTLLTGDSRLHHHVLMAHVHEADSGVHAFWGGRHDGSPGVLRRPAVTV